MRLSEHALALIAARDRLRPAMLRPDMNIMRARAIVRTFEDMERDGTLVNDGSGALVPAQLLEPDRENYPHVGRVCFRLGMMWANIADRLRQHPWPPPDRATMA